MHEKKIGFIVNPISGTRKKDKIPSQIDQNLDKNKFSQAEILFTQHPGHATELAQKLAADHFDYIVAVGGDGTVNETAKGLLHADSALGIVPVGSGNGLARHLQIPMRTPEAIRLLNDALTVEADYGTANGHVFFCTCGTGFDADVSWNFSKSGHRGINSYIESMLTCYFSYKPQRYTLRSNDTRIEQNAFLITFANASQYGNNVYIAPQAVIDDGLLDIAILSEFPVTAIPEITLKLLTKQIASSFYMTFLQTPEITLESEMPTLLFHIDGEAISLETPVNIGVVRGGLKVLTQKKDRKPKFPILPKSIIKFPIYS